MALQISSCSTGGGDESEPSINFLPLTLPTDTNPDSENSTTDASPATGIQKPPVVSGPSEQPGGGTGGDTGSDTGGGTIGGGTGSGGTGSTGSTGSGGSGGTVGSGTGDPKDITLTWTAPSEREDRSALSLSEIAGYNIYYGTEPGQYNDEVKITDSSADGYIFTELASGRTYYFVITTYDTESRESLYSSVITVSI